MQDSLDNGRSTHVFDNETLSPIMPEVLEETGLDPSFLADLALKVASSDTDCASEHMSDKMKLPMGITESVLQHLYREKYIEIRGRSGLQKHRYAMLDRGWDRVQRLLSISGYIGPAPVSLETYTAGIRWLFAHTKTADPEHVARVYSHLVLSANELETFGLIVNSRRSLFLTGPSGSGKTTVAMALHSALQDDIWVPYAIEVDGHVIRVLDPRVHHPVDQPKERYDKRWVKTKRPLVIVGGEWTLESMDLIFAGYVNFYEAPFQVKANCGVLIMDDFGRQRMEPHALLNRWIIPLENHVDYLTLNNGKKIEVPLEQLLVFATNLDPKHFVDEAFWRRIGYRLSLTSPSPETYSQILQRYIASRGLNYEPQFLFFLLSRYDRENREMRGCEPRDLVERCLDICKYQNLPRRITVDILDRAWRDYFGATE